MISLIQKTTKLAARGLRPAIVRRIVTDPTARKNPIDATPLESTTVYSESGNSHGATNDAFKRGKDVAHNSHGPSSADPAQKIVDDPSHLKHLQEIHFGQKGLALTKDFPASSNPETNTFGKSEASLNNIAEDVRAKVGAGEERAIKKKKAWLKEWIKEELHKLWIALKQLGADAVRLYMYYATKQGFDTYTPMEYTDRQRIKMDLFKFIPYAFFIIVPGAELLVPPYILLFPNASPTPFMDEQKIAARLKKAEDRQKEAFEHLSKKFKPLFAPQYERIAALISQLKDDPFNVELKRELRELDAYIHHELIKNWSRLQKKLRFTDMSLDDFDYVTKFMFFDFVDGVHIINVFLNMHKKIANLFLTKVLKSKPRFQMTRYTFNFFPLNEMRKYFLRKQLAAQFRRLETQDYLTEQHPDSLEHMKSTDLYKFSRQRGINVQEDTDRIRFYEEVWVQDTRNINKPELKFWMTLSRFSYGKYLV
jgi:LETM1 and EF-hand domain-containing protein 1